MLCLHGSRGGGAAGVADSGGSCNVGEVQHGCNWGTGRPCLTKESSRLARLSEGGVGRVGGRGAHYQLEGQ